MKMVNALALCLFAIGIGLSYEGVLFGSWEKDSFEKNDMYIDRSRSLSVKAIFSQFYANKKEDDMFEYSLEIYRKIVNGFRFKLFFVVNDKAANEVSFFTSIVNAGPFSERKPSFNVEKVEKMKPETKVSNDKSTLAKLQEAVDKYTDTKSSPNLNLNVLSKYSLPEISNTSFYLVESAKARYVVFGEKDSFSVDAQLN